MFENVKEMQAWLDFILDFCVERNIKTIADYENYFMFDMRYPL